MRLAEALAAAKPRRQRRTRSRPEQSAQIAIVRYLRRVLPRTAIVHHVRNQGTHGGPKGKIVGGILKEMGLVAGFPDLVILLPGARTYFLEIKADKGAASEAQQYIWQRLRILGFECALVRSIEETRNALKSWHIETKEAA